MQFTVAQIAQFVNGTIEGDESAQLNSFAKIEEGCPGALSFLSNSKYESYIYTTKSTAVLVNNSFIPQQPIQATLIRVENAYSSLAALMQMVESMQQTSKQEIHPTAIIANGVKIGENVGIGAFTYIEENVTIGDNTTLYPRIYIGKEVSIGKNVIIYPNAVILKGSVISDNCILQAGCVIGSDGFGFAPHGNTYRKIPQIGNVVLEEDVEVGANTTIDRATMGSTRIRRGTKLDNQIQIAHNVDIGENCVIAAQAGIAGSSKIGRNCMFGGQVGMIGHIEVGDRVNIAAKTGIVRPIPSDSTQKGFPNMPATAFNRSTIGFERLPDLMRKIQQLEKEIEQLKTHK